MRNYRRQLGAVHAKPRGLKINAPANTFLLMPSDIIIPRDEGQAAAALSEARDLARAFRSHMPEGDLRLFDEVLAKAGPFIRTLTSNTDVEPRDAFTLSMLAQALFMLGQLRDEVAEMRREGT